MLRSPRNVFFTVLAFTIVCFALSGLIGQHNDGPWGGLPEWLGSASWFGFLLGLLATILTGIYLLVRSMRGRGRATTS
jgi:ABC-type branched-subunit amino acid transport system permease subunit